jgi:predicted DNA-binding transcriptional regulator AlpA
MRRIRAEPEQTSDRYIGTRELQRRYGNISHMTIERRLANDPSFPKPIKFGHLRMWKISDLEVYERPLVVARSA